MNVSNRHTAQCVGYAIKYYLQYEQQCDNIAKRANELIELAELRDFIDGDITCEYQKSNGLVLVFELHDNDAPLNIRFSSFFDLFAGDISEITIQDLKRLSL